ncbi:nonselective cation channel [Metarhizium album ARSEF 1941]|uniref:Nonselective cation channel n=1 Tax=Metarhizium album (strain ARSEF 1941) TaxID=1081103 RepID=A0A0B2WNX3_METAS|nr:nonselective cation channel [Metarhizium album ARSEF 1941]KHN94695.1 nonselective cation channel [Metarhizium album ARSEF 1941]
MDLEEDWMSDEPAGESADVDLLEPEESEPESVYVTLHRVRRLVLASIDDPYTLDHFRQPTLNALIVRPLVDRLYETQNIAIGKAQSPVMFESKPKDGRAKMPSSTVYCLLANRVFFLKSQSGLATQSVNRARSILCELVATRVIRRFHEDNPGNDGLLLLAQILVEGFDPFDGAPHEVEREGRDPQWPVQSRGGYERKLTALELAILSESKAFISSAACQRLVEAVHVGKVVYTPLSFMDILPDHYKHRPIQLYDPRESRILNHRRLIVPRIRALIEMAQFMALVFLYVMTMTNQQAAFNRWELAFAVYTAGWVLQEFASVIEHGWELHSQSLWSFLDVSFAAIYGAYLFARTYDLFAGRLPNGYGLHILCVAAPILLTRIAFNLMPHNIVFISLHAMMRDFTLLTFLAVWCFLGFLLALLWLYDADQAERTPRPSSSSPPPAWPTVGKWLLWIWFGLDGTGIAESTRFNVVLGPALMIAFAFLGNTLFLTILVAILTNTFSHIVTNEAAEIRFRRTVLTFEGVKSDSLFSYPPPFNLVAVLAVLPLKFIISPRFFHTINVAIIRVLNGPLLIAISILERRRLWASENKGPRRSGIFGWHFTGFSPHGDIQAVFTAPLPDEVALRIDLLDPVDDVPVLEDDVMSTLSGDVSRSRLRRPKLLGVRREYPRARPRRRSPLRFQV